MGANEPETDLLAHVAMPDVAAAVRERRETILRRWQAGVRELLPDADPLTYRQVRNSIPKILDQIAVALASHDPAGTNDLLELTKEHGVTRFHQAYDVRELFTEYRLLRRLVIEEVADAAGGLTTAQAVALNSALDLTTQQGLIEFTDHQKEQIRTANEVESRYLAFLSHDLRNHLNHATLLLQLHGRRLKGTPGFEETAADLEEVERSIFQTMAGMDRLLQAERLRKGAVEPKREPVDLRSAASRAAESHRREAEGKGVSLSVEVPAGASAFSDPELIGLVLHNLIGNAVKFSSQGVVRVSAGPVTGGPQGGWVVSVSDQGPGIAPEQQSKLFHAFRRGETHGQPGLGLGLAIASAASKLLGGELRLESAPGAGTTFRFVLPAVPVTTS